MKVNEMAKVISEFNVGKYLVLKLDEAVPNRKFAKYKIGDALFNPVVMYDATNCIAIESSESFKGKTVEFV